MTSTTASAGDMERSANAVLPPSDNRYSAWLLAAPAILFIVVLFVYPLFEIVVISFTEPKVSLNNYYQFFSSKLYSRVLANTIWSAFTVTVTCLLLAYPLSLRRESCFLTREWTQKSPTRTPTTSAPTRNTGRRDKRNAATTPNNAATRWMR